MAPVLVATLAGATSNSYITVADATVYFDNRLDAADWTAATCEAALALLRNPTMLRGVVAAPGSYDEVELGELRVKYRGQGEVESVQAVTDALPWLRSFLKCWAKGVSGPASIRLYRS